MAALAREKFAGSLMVAVFPALLGLCVLPAAARAGWQDFVPTPFKNSVALDIGAAYEWNETALGEQRHVQSDLFVKEKLTVISNGFSYHPRFIQYHLLLATALKQETFKNDGQAAISSNASGFDYDLRLNVLPEHPYRLQLFASRTEPIYKQYLSADAGAVSTRRGAVFSYRKKPFFLNLRSIESSRTWARGTSDLEVYGATGRYFKELGGGRTFSLAPFYDHATARSSSAPGGSAENYGVANTVDLNVSSLESSVSRSLYRQDAQARRLESDGFSWLERLRLQLPLHLKSLLTYRYQTHDRTIAPDGASGGEVRSVDNRYYELDIIHTLYRSLETTYRLRRDSAASADGDTASTTNSLAANYTKSVPRGTFLAGANVSRSETDSAGRTTVADETHERLGLNEVFTALRRDADCGSIRVFLTDHTAGDRPVPVDFVVVPAPGARCDIMVTGIPQDFDETAPHDYTISYTIESGDYTLRTDSYGYNASLALFHNNLNPYFSRTVTSAKLVSGTYPGTPFDGSVSTVGLVLGSLPWRLLGEYQQSDGRADTFRRWRGEIDYSQSVTPTTNVALTASYTSTEYPEGSTAGSPQAYTNAATRLSANLQQRLFRRSLVLSAGGSYTSFEGLMKSSGYSLRASLQWKIGKTTITAGANGFSSRRERLPEPDAERARRYYYLNLRREIF
jgi:hypothetical protein